VSSRQVASFCWLRLERTTSSACTPSIYCSGDGASVLQNISLKKEVFVTATTLSRRGFVGALAAGAMSSPVAASALDDPVYRAIEAHREANARAIMAKTEYLIGHSLRRAARDAEWDAAWALLDVEPMTIAGVMAVLTYIAAMGRAGHLRHTRMGEGETDAWCGRVRFDADAMRWAVQHLARLSGIPAPAEPSGIVEEDITKRLEYRVGDYGTELPVVRYRNRRSTKSQESLFASYRQHAAADSR
jgi:hypothetical protein